LGKFCSIFSDVAHACGRYWTHPARYGEAFFDRREVAAIENGSGSRMSKLR